jgi:hypothetical protein
VWRRLAYLSAAVLAACVGYCLFHLPFDVGDNLGNLLQLVDTSAARIFVGTLQLQGFMRPMTWATMKVVFDASGGHYFVAFRTLHVLAVFLLMLTFVRLARVQSAMTFCLALLSMAALIGIPAFHDAVNETELNTKLCLAAICLSMLALAASEPRRWKDALMLAVLVYAMLANELGLLLWVTVVAAYVVGFRGMSRGAVVAATGLVAVYFYARFMQLHVGTPTLSERSSGIGFRIRDTRELVTLFSGNPMPFYAYNVMAAAIGVLFSEPRAGVFVFVRDLLTSKLQIGTMVNVVTSLLSTLVMAWFVAHRWRRWLRGDLALDDRLFLVSAAVITANAVMSFPYLKDVIMTTGAVFYCVAMYVSLRALVDDLTGRPMNIQRTVAVCAVLATISIGWSLRAISFYADMRVRSYKTQTDWVFVYEWLDAQHVALDTPGQRSLVAQLRAEMLGMDVPKIYFDPPWMKDVLTPD